MEELRGNLSDWIRESCREHQSLSGTLQLLEGDDADFLRENKLGVMIKVMDDMI